MNSAFPRAGLLVAAVLLVAVSVTPAQDRQNGAAAGRHAVNVFNTVEFRTTVLSCKPEGAAVKKGEIVCELDPGPVNERIAQQDNVVQAAESACELAGVKRKLAELAVVEYEEGIYPQELEKIRGEVAMCQSALTHAEDHLAWSDRMLEKGYIARGRHASEQLAVQRARNSFEQAQTKKRVLETFTKGKTIASLRGAVDRAKRGEDIEADET